MFATSDLFRGVGDDNHQHVLEQLLKQVKKTSLLHIMLHVTISDLITTLSGSTVTHW